MNKWLPSLIAFLAVTGLQAQPIKNPPKLVVSIVVDQLRSDYLQYFAPTFGEKGFRRLMDDGLYYHQVEFGFSNVGRSSATATLYTGSYPYYHGIVSDRKYNFDTQKEVSIIADDQYLGNYTSDRFSPLALLCSTIGDELKVASNGNADVYAIAPNADEAVLAAGKYANAAFWLDSYNGKWATTTFYKQVPWYVDRFNTNRAIGNNPERTWTPARTYSELPYVKNDTPFKHSITKGDRDKFLKLKQSPYINTEITDLATQFFEYAGFGTRIYPDMLAITYYAGDYLHRTTPERYSLEVQDTYHHLDKEIERLLDLIDRQVGLHNTLVILTSSGYYNAVDQLPEGFPKNGEFFPQRCVALLNMYLMALYGQGNWVNGCYENQIYLNKKLIEQNKVNWAEILQQSADFVAQFSGIQEVTTAGEWMVDDAGRAVHFRRGMHKDLSGDLFIELRPGWESIDESQSRLPNNQIKSHSALSPLFFFGNGIQKSEVHRKIQATEIAPTVTHILRIRPPNGCKNNPLPEFL